MSLEIQRPSRRAVLKQMALGASGCLIVGAGPLHAAPGARRSRLERAAPESLGVDPAGVLAFLDAVEQTVGGLHSFMLMRHGRVAAEGWWRPYAAVYPHMLFSLSKSFTSTSVGLAVSENRLSVDVPVVSFFKDDAPSTISPNLAAMRVRHLLTMSTGHDKDSTGPIVRDPDGNWARAFLALPVEHAPGSHFVYNSGATYMLSAIVQKLTGMRLLDYLRPRLFDPLGIQGETWERCPRGINTGGWGLSVKTEDIARFGQLLLQRGFWNGKPVVPEAWVAEATSRQISNGTGDVSDWAQGYGYQFWRCRHSAYRGDGAFGQFCVMLPEQDAALAITSGVGDMQAVLNAAWDHLLPALRPEPIRSGDSSGALRQRLETLTMSPPSGAPSSPTGARISGRIFRFDPNDQKLQSASLTVEEDRCRLTLMDERGEHRMECGSRSWLKGVTALEGKQPSKVAARGAWSDTDTYTARLCFYETPFLQTITCRFEGDRLSLSRKQNVSFGPTDFGTALGHAT